MGANCSRYGAAQSRLRQLRIAPHKPSKTTPSQVPIMIISIQLPQNVRGYMQPIGPIDLVKGAKLFYASTSEDVHNPPIRGSLDLEKAPSPTAHQAPLPHYPDLPSPKKNLAKLKFLSVDSPCSPCEIPPPLNDIAPAWCFGHVTLVCGSWAISAMAPSRRHANGV